MTTLVASGICDVCGRTVSGECSRHPWADLLDPRDPDDAAYIAGRRSMVGSKWMGAATGGSALVAVAGLMAVWPAFMISTTAGGVVLLATLAAALVASVTWFVSLFVD